MPARLTQSKREEISWDVLHGGQFRFHSSGVVNWSALARKHRTSPRTCENIWRTYRLKNGLDAMPPIDPLSESPPEVEGAPSDADASMGAPSLGEASDVGTEGECGAVDEACEGDGEVQENEGTSPQTQRPPESGQLRELQTGNMKMKHELEKLLKDVQAGNELVALAARCEELVTLAARCEELSRSPQIAWIDRWIEPHKMTKKAAEEGGRGKQASCSSSAAT